MHLIGIWWRDNHLATGNDRRRIGPVSGLDCWQPAPTPHVDDAAGMLFISISPSQRPLCQIDAHYHACSGRADEDSRIIGGNCGKHSAIAVQQDVCFHTHELLFPVQRAGASIEGNQINGTLDLCQSVEGLSYPKRRAQEESST